MFTTESVTAGHPDKLADQISDTILDAALHQDPNARTAIETLVTPGRITIAGEVSTTARLNLAREAATALINAGYHPDAFTIEDLTVEQSPDIARGVDAGGAGDQGLMFGYATNDPGHLPPAVTAAHRLARALHEHTPTWAGPDGKTQITTDGHGNTHTVLVSLQHTPDRTLDDLHDVIAPLVDEHVGPTRRLLINPTGAFTRGGPDADTGLTGRKIIVDTYGGYARHGGGAFSGKDPSKVDRSAAYAARQAAISLIANGYATRAEVQLAYAIGVDEPVSIHVDTFGTGSNTAAAAALAHIDFTPSGIIHRLELRRPIYTATATYGHFTNPTFPWEQPLAL